MAGTAAQDGRGPRAGATTTDRETQSGYWRWERADPPPDHRYLVPAVLKALGDARSRTLLDVGCGNGALSARLADAGFAVTGIDFEPSGVDLARRAHPGLSFAVHDVGDPLPVEMAGFFDVVVATEIVEHLFRPRVLFARAREALGPQGEIVVSTPYHGYAKNLALALSGKFDDHWGPCTDYGHVKFFSRRTLGALAAECGFEPTGCVLAGRVPALAATMVMRARIR